MIRELCANCEKTTDQFLICIPETVYVFNKRVDFTATFYECSECRGLIETAVMLDKNLIAAWKVYEGKYKKKPEKEFVKKTLLLFIGYVFFMSILPYIF